MRGVTEASIYRTTVEPGNPQASLALWRACIEDTTTFRLQSNSELAGAPCIAGETGPRAGGPGSGQRTSRIVGETEMTGYRR